MLHKTFCFVHKAHEVHKGVVVQCLIRAHIMPIASHFCLEDHLVKGRLEQCEAQDNKQLFELGLRDQTVPVLVELVEGLPVAFELLVAQPAGPDQGLGEVKAQSLILLVVAVSGIRPRKQLCSQLPSSVSIRRTKELRQQAGQSLRWHCFLDVTWTLNFVLILEDMAELADLIPREPLRVPIEVHEQNHFLELQRPASVKVDKVHGLLHSAPQRSVAKRC
mmetsp:Transcript_31591/g.79772  ORF Transcript_31591/g.79772 Transcript_31591/m.79772 type:complete len:220 (-) Transcript_31591:1167-1826(-)